MSAAPPEKWYDAYKRGMSAVNARSYRAGADALQKAIAEMPNEGTGVRAGREIIIYVPHFWLGIAKFNLGDVDGALREWHTSEEQGVITRTEYYARMKDWVSRAQTEKQRNAQSEASGPKKEADAAISKALAMQVDALSAGGDRSESYRSAQRKLQEALSQFHKAGTDVTGYAAAQQTAQQASTLFATAAEEGKKLKAARQAMPAVVPKPKPAPPQQQAPVLITNVPPAVVTPPPARVDTAPPPPVESEAEVAARVAVQQYRRNVGEAPQAIARAEVREAERLRRELESAKSDGDFARIARDASDRDAAMVKKIAEALAPAPTATPASISAPPSTPDLSGAFRAYAAGDLAGSEQLLTRILQVQPGPEAYVLRGCARYTRAMLSRTPDALLAAARADFKAALQRNRTLRLDRAAFSPKLVAFFEQVREQR
jgi:tetratricopeptide (TPR) repeat protein